MAAAGETGVLAALLAYALLSSLCGNPAESPVVYPNRKNISSQCQGVEIQIGITSTGHKHLGFGRGIIHTCVWAKSPNIGPKRKTWAVRKPKNNNGLVISLCLLLSGDIHQCPGPETALRENAKITSLPTASTNKEAISHLQLATAANVNSEDVP